MSEKDKLTRMSIDIDPNDHKKLKIRAAKERRSIRDFVIDCIQDKMCDQTGDKKEKLKS